MPSDAAFREALDAFGDAYANEIEFNMRRTKDRLAAALARLLALYAERQGEVYEVRAVMPTNYAVDEVVIAGPVGALKPLTRVRVARVEAHPEEAK